MMVKQTKHLFQVRDIRAVRVECKKCSNEIILRLCTEQTIPDECPMCRCSNWILGTYADDIVRQLRKALGADERVNSTIRFEVDGEEGK